MTCYGIGMFIKKLEEAMSFASYMDVSELRMLYYGRLGINVAFSDDDKIPMEGFEDNRLTRPWGITSHAVDTVVGRKASTHYYYGHIFRLKNLSGEWLEDIKSYTNEKLRDDIDALRVIPYIEPLALESAIETVLSDPKHRYPFAKIWDITRLLATPKGSLGDKYWRRIFLDLGYSGFNDPKGLGIIGARNQQTTLLLETDRIEEFDIMPVQKYRKDRRQRIIDAVNKKNKFNQTRRNRVAKKKTAAFRPTPSRSDRFKKDMESLKFILAGGL